jgi:hypothetical protein
MRGTNDVARSKKWIWTLGLSPIHAARDVLIALGKLVRVDLCKTTGIAINNRG